MPCQHCSSADVENHLTYQIYGSTMRVDCLATIPLEILSRVHKIFPREHQILSCAHEKRLSFFFLPNVLLWVPYRGGLAIWHSGQRPGGPLTQWAGPVHYVLFFSLSLNSLQLGRPMGYRGLAVCCQHLHILLVYVCHCQSIMG